MSAAVVAAVVAAVAGLHARMRDHQVQRHLVDDRNWYAFGVPAMDDLFSTNPNVGEVRVGGAHEGHREQRGCDPDREGLPPSVPDPTNKCR